MSWRYVLGAIGLHVLFLGVFGLTLISIKRDAPPPQLAIQGMIVDAASLKQRPTPRPRDREREEQRRQEQQREEEAKQQKLREEQQRQDTERKEQERKEAERKETERKETERLAEEQRQLEVKQREEQQRAEQQRVEREQREREAKAKREADAEAERKRVAEIQRKQKEAEEARVQQQREADLKQQMADEEGEMQVAQAGVVDRYRALIEQHIYRNWNRPPSARAGVECNLTITQAQGGVVLSVKIGDCNGDAAMRQSIENAVLKASPLPPPPDPRAFERIVNLKFKPRD